MLQFVAYRVAQFIPTALGVLLLTFFLLHLAPGDPIDILLGEHALPADREAMRVALGLNLPLYEQLAHFFKGVFTGDLGTSLANKRPVIDLIWEKLPATAWLAVCAMGLAMVIAVPSGILAAIKARSIEGKIVNTLATLAFAIPTFWLGPLLIIVFSLWFGWLPVSGNEQLSSVILPAVTLSLALAAVITRMLRASLLETLEADYVRTARAKGAAEKRVRRHAFKNALLPLITVVFLQLGMLLTGTILTEAIFSWPGLGNLLVESLHSRDYPVVQGCVLLIAFVYMLSTLLADIVSVWVNPRMKEVTNV